MSTGAAGADSSEGGHHRQAAKRALEDARAGDHPILLIGPAGAGKTLLAWCIPGLLPPPTKQEAAEIAEIYRRAQLDPPPADPSGLPTSAPGPRSSPAIGSQARWTLPAAAPFSWTTSRPSGGFDSGPSGRSSRRPTAGVQRPPATGPRPGSFSRPRCGPARAAASATTPIPSRVRRGGSRGTGQGAYSQGS
jgi:energy-coupling factor transporter ATP-binding protein EcfA2